jgi:hypothetical protein
MSVIRAEGRGELRRARSDPQPSAATAGLAAIAIALLLGTWWRLRNVGGALLFGDELHTLRDISGGYGDVLSQFSATGSGMALPLLQRISIDLFGAGHWSIRAPAWLAGLGLLYLTLPWARRILGSQRAAVYALALVAGHPLLIFYSHFGRAYSLVALLSLLLLERLMAVVDGRASARASLPWLTALTALLPWVHPTALGFVLPAYAGALLALQLDRERPAAQRSRAIEGVFVALGLGGLTCALLHLPAAGSMRAFLEAKTTDDYYGSFGVGDVAALLFGGRTIAVAMVLGFFGSATLLVRQWGARSLPLLLACLGPAVTIGMLRPYGDAYAYARYVLPGVVPAFMVIGWGLEWVMEQSPVYVRRPVVRATALGVALLGLHVLSGSFSPLVARDGPHANTYLGMLPLAAFDREWPEAPPFYRTLRQRAESSPAPLRIVEMPALTTRTRHLYRSHYRVHRVDTSLAPTTGEWPRIPHGPYVSLHGSEWTTRADADYLVVHLDIAREVKDYWRFVYEDTVPQLAWPGLPALLQRHERYGGALLPADPTLISQLERELGEPSYRDAYIAVWKLR